MIQWSKDLGRTLDYLETRPDIDRERLAYYGLSLGAGLMGPTLTAIEGRFKASVLLAGGLRYETEKYASEVDPSNFVRRVRVPTLLVNGRDDFFCPPEECVRPLLQALGADNAHKRLALLDGGHAVRDRAALIREVLDWLDRYLGPVGRKE